MARGLHIGFKPAKQPAVLNALPFSVKVQSRPLDMRATVRGALTEVVSASQLATTIAKMNTSRTESFAATDVVNGSSQAGGGTGFIVPMINFQSGIPSAVDLTQYVPGWNASTMSLTLQGALPASITFNGTALVYDGTGGAATVSGLVLFIVIISDIPDYISALSSFQISRLSSATNGKVSLNDTMPADWIAANGVSVGQNWNIMAAFSGGVGDPWSRKLWIHGGGHSDGANNGIWYYDLSGIDQPAGWSLVDISNANAVRDAETYSDGRPSSIHSYTGLLFDPTTNSMTRFFGSRWQNGSTPSSAYRFDFNANSWSSDVANGDSNSSTVICDPSQRKALVLNHSGNWFFYRIDTRLKGGSGTAIQQQFDSISSYDPTRNIALVISGGTPELYKLQINWSAETITMTQITPSGMLATAVSNCTRGGLFYDSTNDCHWALPLNSNASSMGTVYKIVTDSTGTPTTTTSNATSGATSGYTTHGWNGFYNKGVFVPEWHCIGFATGFDDAAYLLKLP